MTFAIPVPRVALAVALLAGLATAPPARAASNTTVGVGTGAIAGAVVAGPIGALAGAIVGGVVGASSERAGPRRTLRTRAYRAPARRIRRSAEAELPRAAPRQPVTTGSTGSAAAGRWIDPK